MFLLLSSILGVDRFLNMWTFVSNFFSWYNSSQLCSLPHSHCLAINMFSNHFRQEGTSPASSHPSFPSCWISWKCGPHFLSTLLLSYLLWNQLSGPTLIIQMLRLLIHRLQSCPIWLICNISQCGPHYYTEASSLDLLCATSPSAVSSFLPHLHPFSWLVDPSVPALPTFLFFLTSSPKVIAVWDLTKRYLSFSAKFYYIAECHGQDLCYLLLPQQSRKKSTVGSPFLTTLLDIPFSFAAVYPLMLLLDTFPLYFQ